MSCQESAILFLQILQIWPIFLDSSQLIFSLTLGKRQQDSSPLRWGKRQAQPLLRWGKRAQDPLRWGKRQALASFWAPFWRSKGQLVSK